MTALEESQKTLKESIRKVEIIKLLQKAVVVPILNLFVSGETIWATLGEMTLNDAIKMASQLKAVPMGAFRTYCLSVQPLAQKVKGASITKYKKPYSLNVRPSDFRGESEKYELYFFIEVEPLSFVKVIIPITDIKDRLTMFTRSGSTTRSKVVRTSIRQVPKPFNCGFVWGGGGVSDTEFYII